MASGVMFNSLRQYLNEIGQYPLLSAGDEIYLARRYKEFGDEDAREQLINSNLRLVVSIAKAYKNNHLPLQDLISEGNLGLMTAVEKYNPELGYRFSTCATPWIKQAISKAITDKGKSIRLPAHIFQLLSQYKKVVSELLATLDSNEVTDELIAAKMNITVDKVKMLRELKHDAISLDTPLNDDTEDTIADLVADNNSKSPAEEALKSSLRDKLIKVVDTFDERTRTIVKMRFGLASDAEADDPRFNEEHTLEAIGNELKLTRERVRQILNGALQTIRTNYKEEDF